MDISLVMFKADGARKDFPVDKSRIVIGRTKHCDLRVPLGSISRQHCEILVTDDRISIRDLGSSNGTYHNNNRVQEATLAAGDEVMVGPVVFTIVVNGQPDNIKPVRTLMAPDDEMQESLQMAGEEPLELSEDDELPDEVEPEAHSPTVDLDDPIAALEALSEMDDDEELKLEE